MSAVPFRIPDLELIERLGAGAQGTVFRARRGDEYYAVKLSREQVGRNVQREMRRFRREAVALARVRHPVVPQVLEIGDAGGSPYIVMELAAGETLSARLRRGVLERALAIAIGRRLAEGLHAIHKSGLIHRDVKPDNIVLELDTLTVRLVDFGFAAALDPAILAGERAGTRSYMAPEQLDGSGRVDARADLYSLGCVLFECLHGRPPPGRIDVGAGEQPERGSPPSSDAFEDVIAKLLAVAPDDRYPSAAELVEALLDLEAGRPKGHRGSAHAQAMGSVLIGRELELERLRGAWADTRGGRAVLARIVGAPGSGKTRLSAAFVDELRGADTSLLEATCQLGEPVPFSGVRQLLESRLAFVDMLSGAERLRAIARLRELAGDLAPLLPLVSQRVGRLVADVARLPRSDDAEHVMAEGLAEFCAKLLRENSPSVVIVDDIQWLDSGSRRVLAKLADRVAEDAVLFVLASRSSSYPGSEALARPFGDDVVDVELGPLRESDLAILVSGYLGGAHVGAELVERLLNVWDGTPLGALELVRAMLESGVLVPHWGRWVLDGGALAAMDLPHGSTEVLARRIASLEPDTRDVMAAAAVLGMRFEDRLLGPICSVSSAAIHAALEDGRRAQLATPGLRGTHTLVHAAVREALLGTLSAERIREVHQRAAEVLDAQEIAAEPGPGTAPGESPSAELALALLGNEQQEHGSDDALSIERCFTIASHYARGDPASTPERALCACVRAARLAFRSFDNARALEYFATAEIAAEAAGSELEPELQLLIGEALLRTGALDQSLARFQRVLGASDEALLQALTLSRMAWVQLQLDEDAAWECLQRGFARLGVRPPSDSLGSLLRSIVAWLPSRLFRPKIVRSAHERRRLDVLCSLYYQASRLAAQGSRQVRLIQAILGGLRAGERLGPTDALAKSYFFYSFLLTGLGLRAGGRRYLDAAEVVARETQDSVTYSHALEIRFGIAAWAGDMVDATRSAATCLRDHGHWRELTEYCLVADGLQQILALQGRCSEAWSWLSQAVRKVEQHEGAPMALEFLEASVRASLLALDRENEIERTLERIRSAQVGTRRKSVFVGSMYGVRAREFTECMRLDEKFEELVAEVRAQKLDPRRVHMAATEYYVHVAHARLHQCLRAEPESREQRIARFSEALHELGLAARVPLLKGHYRALLGALRCMQEDWDAAEQAFTEAERLGVHESAPWVLYTVHRGRAHMLDARGKPEAARDQARLAEALARAHGAGHRVRWIREEFGASSSIDTPQGINSSFSLLLEPSHAERGTSHSVLRARGYLRALQRITRASRVELDPALQSRFVLDEILRAMRAERGALLVLREDGEEVSQGTARLTVSAARGGQLDLTDFSYERDLVNEAFRSGSVVTMDRGGTDTGGRRAAIAAPLLIRGTSVGALYLERPVGASAFTDVDAEVVSALAAQVPVALELARILYERERAAETVRMAEKMDALGRFAGGVAHDFRNLFQQVLITAEFLVEQQSDPELGEHLAAIRESIRRAARLTERLNDFARSGAHHMPEIIDLGGEIEAMRPVLESLLGPGIELDLSVGAELWNVKMDVAQLDQVLMNLLVNARDAMPEGGRVTIETKNVVLDEAYVGDHPWLARRECVEVSVMDTGTGMDAVTRAHIFEPYFTTKAVGRGTGLGLATVYGAIRQNGGHIEVESEPTVGTTFRIHLPRSLAPLSTVPKQRPLPEGESGAWKQARPRLPSKPDVEGPLVLVVDDDNDVRDALCRILSMRGYSFLAVTGPNEALELFRQRAGEIDAVVTDLVMPGMNGVELSRELEKLRPVPTILVSGANDAVLAEHGLIGAKNFLPKPVLPNDLDAKLRELFKARGESLRTA